MLVLMLAHPFLGLPVSIYPGVDTVRRPAPNTMQFRHVSYTCLDICFSAVASSGMPGMAACPDMPLDTCKMLKEEGSCYKLLPASKVDKMCQTQQPSSGDIQACKI